ncbi:MAG TPA: hypothetical protein DDZ80_07840 [Cyanobacteria bacterium UBA8803]|nr:hypothetical protein [Cyanobacteria bacterium UBA8803]
MPHNPPATCSSHVFTDFSEEQFDAVVELADTIRELTDQLIRVQQSLDIYELRLLRTESEMLQLYEQPDSNKLKQWQEFIERVATELNSLSPPV